MSDTDNTPENNLSLEMPPAVEPSIIRMSSRSAGILLLFTLAFTA
jgi:hypothetical protein